MVTGTLLIVTDETKESNLKLSINFLFAVTTVDSALGAYDFSNGSLNILPRVVT